MSLFIYQAMDTQGHIIRGQLQAVNLVDLESRLKRLGLDLVDGQVSIPRIWHFSRGVPRRELINFCFHMEMLARAGIPIMEAMADVRDTTENARLKETMATLIEGVEGGQHLSRAMEEHPDVFSGVMVSVIRAGEQSGRLQDVLLKLAENLKWEDELASYTRRLFIYPAIVSTMVLLALSVAMIFVVPQLSQLFANSGQQLPLHTRALIGTSFFFVHYWQAMLAFLTLVFVGLKIGLATLPELRFRFDGLKLRLPIVGNILKKIILCRFTSLFALMYSSGITIMDAVRLCEGIVGNTVVRAGLIEAAAHMTEGQSLTEAFSKAGVFPPLVIRMMRVGEQAGNLEQALSNASYFFDRDVKETTLRLQAMIEPLLTVILGGIMAWVMLSVLGPVYNIITKLKV
ncbi:MAG: type II secretion system F family protein [Rhodocyclaceae bacterium]|nr:type II secretion system F family protein [Rhodocyclaceae bacterium]